MVHRVPAATAVVQPDEHDASGGIQEQDDFAGEECRSREESDESGKCGAGITGEEDEHEDLECCFHWSAFVGSSYCTHRAKPALVS